MWRSCCACVCGKRDAATAECQGLALRLQTGKTLAVAIALGYIAGDKAAKWARSQRMLQVPACCAAVQCLLWH